MFSYIRRHLAIKISLLLALLATPLLAVGLWAVLEESTSESEKATIDIGKAAAITGATAYGTMLEAGLDAGEYTLESLMSPFYEEITNVNTGDTKRYHTAYDIKLERWVPSLLDSTLGSSSFFFYALANDVNGYCPANVTKFRAQLTGNPEVDVVKNREKRMFTTPMHIRAAQSVAPVLVQPYTRDSGDLIWDVAAPIYVRGQHWGVFRVGVSRAAIDVRKHELTIRYAVGGFALALLLASVVLVVLRRSTRTLSKLANLATNISTGEALDEKVPSTGPDEVGQVAKAVDRLRKSVKLAMGRLSTHS